MGRTAPAGVCAGFEASRQSSSDLTAPTGYDGGSTQGAVMGVGKNIKSGIDLLEDLLREVNKPAKAAVKAAPVAPTLLPAVPTVQAPAVVIPSRLNEIKEAVRQSKGNYGARRVERAADEVPNLESLYNEQALRSAFKGDNAKALMTMNPRNFEHYARPLDKRFTDEFSTRHGRNGQQMSYREYMEDYLPNVGGFDDVPFLMINKEEIGLPLTPFLTGHEGRHRNRVLANKGEGAGLVQLLSEGDLRTELPRKTQEEYIEALRKELGLTDNLVYPEKYSEPGESVFDNQIQRPAIKLPDIYAEGGDVHMMGGGRPPKKTTLEEDLKSFKDPAIALADYLAGALRGTTAAATGFAGDMEELYRQYGKGAIANAVRQLVPTREGKATTLPTIEEMNAMLPPVVPTGAGRSTRMADIGQFLGENNPAAPTAIAAVKPVARAVKAAAPYVARGALNLARSEPARRAGNRVAQAAGVAPMRIVPESTVSVGQVIKGAQDILPTAEREANLAKFLEKSAEKRRMYHGSDKPNITQFKTGKMMMEERHPGNTVDPWAVDNREAVFLTPETEFSNKYSGDEWNQRGDRAPTTYPVYVQAQNPWDFGNPEHIEAAKQKHKELFPIVPMKIGDKTFIPSDETLRHHQFDKWLDYLPERENNWTGIESPDLQAIIKALGHDSFYINEHGTKNLGVYDPNKIKSAFGNRGTYDIDDPDINKAEGGAVMMADGGSADFFIDPSSYAHAKSKEMYPKKKSEWTERDAARHMLASGMMAQKFGPTVAKMAGLAHEHFNAPVKTLGYALGIGKMPADYEQDLHNNALGIDLAKRAATQEELERLIKEMTSKSSKTQTEGIPFIGEPKNAARLSDY